MANEKNRIEENEYKKHSVVENKNNEVKLLIFLS